MPDVTDFEKTSRVASIANTLNSSTAQKNHLNSEMTNLYLSKFGSWAAEVRNGTHDNSNPPQPPNGYRLSAPDTYGYQWPEIGTDPVCSMPSVPASVGATPVPHVEGDDLRNVGPGDTQPVGFIYTDPSDGSQWRKFKRKTPFGEAFGYERVK